MLSAVSRLRDAGLEAGADDYLQKPILHHDLLSKIRKMLDLQSVD